MTGRGGCVHAAPAFFSTVHPAAVSPGSGTFARGGARHLCGHVRSALRASRYRGRGRYRHRDRIPWPLGRSPTRSLPHPTPFLSPLPQPHRGCGLERPPRGQAPVRPRALCSAGERYRGRGRYRHRDRTPALAAPPYALPPMPQRGNVMKPRVAAFAPLPWVGRRSIAPNPTGVVALIARRGARHLCGHVRSALRAKDIGVGVGIGIGIEFPGRWAGHLCARGPTLRPFCLRCPNPTGVVALSARRGARHLCGHVRFAGVPGPASASASGSNSLTVGARHLLARLRVGVG
jgi:hypothetical protein